MQLYFGFEEFPRDVATVVTVGSFDGVHAGHRVLLDRVHSLATRLEAKSVVVTFEPHPRIAMGRAEGMKLLTTVEERAALLEQAGVDYVVVAYFDDKFRSQSFGDFVRESLVAKLGMRGLVVGYNHRLGRGNEGRYETLLPIAEECGFVLERVEQHTATGAKISSTVVRGELEMGNAARAAELMGHPYIIYGTAESGVVTLTNEHKLLPAEGLYIATVSPCPHSVAQGGGQSVEQDKVQSGEQDEMQSKMQRVTIKRDGITLPESLSGELLIAIHSRL